MRPGSVGRLSFTAADFQDNAATRIVKGDGARATSDLTKQLRLPEPGDSAQLSSGSSRPLFASGLFAGPRPKSPKSLPFEPFSS